MSTIAEGEHRRANGGERAGAGAPLLEVDDLCISFARGSQSPFRAVRGVSFALHERQTLAIVGESGSGKSVTALSILRLLASPPAIYERGRVVLRSGGVAMDLLGVDEAGMRAVRGGAVGMIFQEPMTSLNPVLTVGEQIVEAVVLHQGVRGGAARDAGIAAMREVGIKDAAARFGAYPHQFSGGMRQRIMIAMALACRPRVLLADEPTTALDVTVQAQILGILGALKREKGMGIVLITHDLGLVADHADAVCVMYGGRVVEFGRTEDVLGNPLHPYTRGLLACIPRIDEPRARLRTVHEHLERVEDCELRAGDGGNRGIRMWWPAHEAPAGVVEAGGEPVLVKVGDERWVMAWGTAGAMEMKAEGAPRVSVDR